VGFSVRGVPAGGKVLAGRITRAFRNMPAPPPVLSLPLRAALGRFSAATAAQVHRLQLGLAELLLAHAPPAASAQLALALGFIEGRVPAQALHEARQDCWTYVGSLACGCSVADSASAHAVMICLETDDAAHSPDGLSEQLERALRCGATEAELLRLLSNWD
jgi:hypothetical protein